MIAILRRSTQGLLVCNLYTSTTNAEAIRQFSRYLSDLVDKFQSNEETFDVYPNRYGPIVRQGETGHELVRARWGMPSPLSTLKGKSYDYGVTNIRNTGSPHWRRWLAPQFRCLVPLVKFAEPDPASKKEGERMPDAWFARPDGSLFFFAGDDTRSPLVKSLIPGGGLALQTDDDRYVSIAAMPILVGPESFPWGVAIATSNQPSHFSVHEEPGVHPAEAVRAIAGMAALGASIVMGYNAKEAKAGE